MVKETNTSKLESFRWWNLYKKKENKRRANPNKPSVNPQEGETKEVLRCIFLKAFKILIRNSLL